MGLPLLRCRIAPHSCSSTALFTGGVIAHAIDNAITFAAGTVLGPSILTAGISVVYLRPAGAAITATVVGKTKRQASARCEVHPTDVRGNDVLVATGQGTAMLIEREVLGRSARCRRLHPASNTENGAARIGRVLGHKPRNRGRDFDGLP